MPRFRMFPLKTNNVIQLFEWRDQIDLDPPYQRIAVWDKYKQQCFIDSVINGFDIPKLYFHEVTLQQQQNRQHKYSVIDGKQRLQALWDFMTNKIPLSNDFTFFDDESLRANGKYYRDLLALYPRLRARFDSFDVPVTVVQTEDENFIEDLFARLNIQVPLSAPEYRNTLGGPIPYLIRKIGVSPFFKESVRITNNRLQHFDLAAKFIYLTRADAIESTHKGILNKFVLDFKRLRDAGPSDTLTTELTQLERKTREILDKMHSFFDSQDWLLTSQGRTTLYFHIFRLYYRLGQDVSFNRQMIAQFDEELTAARKKSQRLATGSREELTDLEQNLVLFDREKQSLNDAGALKRQYDYLRTYFSTAFGVQLPNLG